MKTRIVQLWVKHIQVSSLCVEADAVEKTGFVTSPSDSPSTQTPAEGEVKWIKFGWNWVTFSGILTNIELHMWRSTDFVNSSNFDKTCEIVRLTRSTKSPPVSIVALITRFTSLIRRSIIVKIMSNTHSHYQRQSLPFWCFQRKPRWVNQRPWNSFVSGVAS